MIKLLNFNNLLGQKKKDPNFGSNMSNTGKIVKKEGFNAVDAAKNLIEGRVKKEEFSGKTLKGLPEDTLEIKGKRTKFDPNQKEKAPDIAGGLRTSGQASCQPPKRNAGQDGCGSSFAPNFIKTLAANIIDYNK